MPRDNHRIDNRKLRKVFNRFIKGVDFYLEGTEVILNSHGSYYTRMIGEYLLSEQGRAMVAIANDIDYRVRVNYLAESVAGKVYTYPTHVMRTRLFRPNESGQDMLVADVMELVDREYHNRFEEDTDLIQGMLESAPEMGTLEVTRIPDKGITEQIRKGVDGHVLSMRTIYSLEV